MSSSLGFGFRCGFLGLLHMDIVRERLEREYDLDLIITAPSVVYHSISETGEVTHVQNPSAMPDMGSKRRIEEPYVKCGPIAAMQRPLLLLLPASAVHATPGAFLCHHLQQKLTSACLGAFSQCTMQASPCIDPCEVPMLLMAG